MPVQIDTPRLRLRELRHDDLDFIAAMRADPEVMHFWPAPESRAQAAEWLSIQLQRYQRDGVGQWLALLRETNCPVGVAGLMCIELEGVPGVEVGYMIHRPFWRQGYASEAAAAAREYAFRVLRCPRLVARIRPENLPSQGVARKIGMTPEPRIVQHAGLPHQIFSMPRPS